MSIRFLFQITIKKKIVHFAGGNLIGSSNLHQCRMRLCSLSTDARQDDLTPLWSDRLWGREEERSNKKKGQASLFPEI